MVAPTDRVPYFSRYLFTIYVAILVMFYDYKTPTTLFYTIIKHYYSHVNHFILSLRLRRSSLSLITNCLNSSTALADYFWLSFKQTNHRCLEEAARNVGSLNRDDFEWWVRIYSSYFHHIFTTENHFISGSFHTAIGWRNKLVLIPCKWDRLGLEEQSLSIRCERSSSIQFQQKSLAARPSR